MDVDIKFSTQDVQLIKPIIVHTVFQSTEAYTQYRLIINQTSYYTINNDISLYLPRMSNKKCD